MSGEEPTRPRATWEEIVARFARFSGIVGEVADPLTWGLDLDEETVIGADHWEPSEERFLRSYLTFTGETLDLETLRVPALGSEHAAEITRTALSSALAASLHGDTTAEDDFLDSYADYRAAMRAIIAEVEHAGLSESTLQVNGVSQSCVRVDVRGVAATYATVADRALVLSGPADLLARVDVVTRPIRNILHGEEGPRF